MEKKFGFGMMRMPFIDGKEENVDLAQVCEMADEFLAEGFTYFDTAYMYHGGRSEETLRRAVVERHPRASFTVADKLPLMPDFISSADMQRRITEEQLARCGVDYFDYYLVHNVGEEHYAIAEKFDTFSYMARLKEEGIARQIGFSYHDDAKLLDKILTDHPEVDFVQLQINYLDWDNAGIQSRLCYETARKHGKPVVVMEPVKGGTLAKLPAEAQSILRALDPTRTNASWAIRFAAGLDGVKTVLSGVSDLAQMRDTISFMRDFEPLTEEEKSAVFRVADIVNGAVTIPCTGCGYCVDGCPKRIPIPTYFSLYNAEQIADNKQFSTQQTYYDNLIKSHGKASECIACKKCEHSCPQHIPVTEWLKKVARSFEQA